MRRRRRRHEPDPKSEPLPRKAGEWTQDHTQRVFVRPLRSAGYWGTLALLALGVHLFVIELIDRAI